MESEKFVKLRKTPLTGVISELDSIEFAKIAPTESEVQNLRQYYSRNGFLELCVQAAVTAEYRFCFMSAKHAGVTHDSNAIQRTRLWDLITSVSSSLLECAYIVEINSYEA